MTLNVGDPIPSVDLFVMGAAGPEKVNTADV
ncbi:MAG TPA: peroxiredoxin, partial [Acidimicrobiaceae bacterium]|nr:peroxiredoxin [Acidimicrobiaceae bacterium]